VTSGQGLAGFVGPLIEVVRSSASSTSACGLGAANPTASVPDIASWAPGTMH